MKNRQVNLLLITSGTDFFETINASTREAAAAIARNSLAFVDGPEIIGTSSSDTNSTTTYPTSRINRQALKMPSTNGATSTVPKGVTVTPFTVAEQKVDGLKLITLASSIVM